MAGTKAEEEEEEERKGTEREREREREEWCSVQTLPISPLLDYFCCLMGLLAWPLSHSLKTDSFVGRRTTTTTTTTPPFGTDLWELLLLGGYSEMRRI